MNELETGVIETESPAVDEEQTGVTEEAVNEPEVTPTEENVETVAEPVEEVEEYETPDDRSWKNKYKEQERKANELTELLPTMIEEAVKKASSKGEDKPKYTVSQLEQYAIENPEYRPWVEEQKDVLRQEQINKSIEARLGAEKKQMQEQQARNQAYGYVQNNYPDLFLKDKAGNARWNDKNPVVGAIAQYLKDPRMANQADGIVIATKLAYADYYQNNATTLKTKQKLTESVLKKEQRKNMVGGNGVANVPVKDSYSDAMQRLAEKRDKGSAANAIKQILISKGMIKE